MGLEDDFLLADADDEKTIEFIKNYLPQELLFQFLRQIVFDKLSASRTEREVLGR